MIDCDRLNMLKLYLAVCLLLAALFSGCAPMALDTTPLQKGEMRSLTGWCAGAAPFGAPVGACYFHSERGWGVVSQQSPGPSLPKAVDDEE